MKVGKIVFVLSAIALLAIFTVAGVTHAAKDPDGPENLGSNQAVGQAFPEEPLASGGTLTVGEVLNNSNINDERALVITADIVMDAGSAELREEYVGLVRDQNYTLLVAVRPADDINALISQFSDPGLIRALADERRVIFDQVSLGNYETIQTSIRAAVERGELPTLNNLEKSVVEGLKAGV